ncbi:hypothetical protein FIBSPDRAFT_848577, partial [Athelia psychrophila]
MALGTLLHSVTAASLVALSLSNWDDEELLKLITHGSKPHFPSLQHLILTNIASNVRHLAALARAFPDIEQLTLDPGKTASLLVIDLILIIFLYGADDGNVAENDVHSGPLWPKVQTIALSTSTVWTSAMGFERKSMILQLQAAGNPIRKLLLPREVHPAMVEVGEI